MRIQQSTCAFVLATAICLGPCAMAQAPTDENTGRCSSAVVKQVAKHFGLPHFAYPAPGLYPSAENGGLIVAGVCKVWPADRAKTLAVFAYDGGTEYEKQLLLAVIERPGNRVSASYQGVIPEDAAAEVSAYSLRLDTARYTLSEATHAFGVRLSTFRERCTYEGGFDDELTLFVVEGKAIRPVLKETMRHWSYGSGNRCGGEDVPRTDANIVVSVEPTASHGFADLRLTAHRSDQKTPLSSSVKYNGERYDLQAWKSSFDAWWP